ncbi:DUF4140 domain-containing protein [candidate division CSSED10-310 bacterium]|uniref:DUF4140 domain-containing protein n=1 Tax=candidate division CSSED10-310 bacterium TaxID=2855610 RepID=A0ABV6YSQ5_UNCC1
MQKNILFFWALFFCVLQCPQLEADDEIQSITSKIVHVTVYPEWAYVRRQAEAKINAGISKVALTHLPAWIDEKSVRVKINSSGQCKIIGTATN